MARAKSSRDRPVSETDVTACTSGSGEGGGGRASHLRFVTVTEWLASIKLGAYADAIAEEGYEELQLLSDAEEADIEELLGSLLADSSVRMKKPHARTLNMAWGPYWGALRDGT